MLTVGTRCGPFHCLRLNQNCHKPGTCNSNGTCTCPSYFQGDDCSIISADIDAAGCSKLTCQNGGVCVKKGRDVACACPVDYYGSDCSLQRYQVICKISEIIFNINPVGTFEGFASVVGKESIPECRSALVPNPPIADDEIPDTWEGHVLRVKYENSKCGKTGIQESSTRTRYNVTILVQHSNIYITHTDDTILGICYMDKYVTVKNGFRVRNEITTTTTTQAPSATATVQWSSLHCMLAALTPWLLVGLTETVYPVLN